MSCDDTDEINIVTDVVRTIIIAAVGQSLPLHQLVPATAFTPLT